MTKDIIISKLKEIENELDTSKVIVISGASLVLQGIIEKTNDIDLSCEKEFYNSISWPCKPGALKKEIKTNDCFDISDNLYYPNDIVIVDGYKCMNIKKCYEIKKKLNRKKDLKIIKLIEKYFKDKC